MDKFYIRKLIGLELLGFSEIPLPLALTRPPFLRILKEILEHPKAFLGCPKEFLRILKGFLRNSWGVLRESLGTPRASLGDLTNLSEIP